MTSWQSPVLAAAARPRTTARTAAATRTQSRTQSTAATKTQSAADTAKRLRAEWKVAELKLTREAVDDASFTPDIKQTAINAVEWFLQQQEGLITQVEKNPLAEANARKTRPMLEAQFKEKMATIYKDQKLMDELARRMKALDKEMDDMAASADKMFAKLDAVGLTADQKAKLRPVIKDANTKLKKVVEQSKTRSTKDQLARDEVVKHYREAKAKVKQQLTPQQRAKLAQKTVDEG